METEPTINFYDRKLPDGVTATFGGVVDVFGRVWIGENAVRFLERVATSRPGVEAGLEWARRHHDLGEVRRVEWYRFESDNYTGFLDVDGWCVTHRDGSSWYGKSFADVAARIAHALTRGEVVAAQERIVADFGCRALAEACWTLPQLRKLYKGLARETGARK